MRKQDVEAQTVAAVLDRLGLSGFTIAQRESPDFMIEFARLGEVLRVGCEVRRIYADERARGGARLAEFETTWRDIAGRVRAGLSEDRMPVPYCRVDFTSQSYASLRGVQRPRLIEELIRLGRALRAAASVEFPHEAFPIASSVFQRITVLAPDGQGALWWPSHLQSGPVAELDEAVRRAIAEKAAKARRYDWAGATERWLLMVAEGKGLTDMFGRAKPVQLQETLALPFTMVLVWDRFSGDIWTVAPEYRVICNGVYQERHVEALPAAVRPFMTGGNRYAPRPPSRRSPEDR